MVWLQRKLPRPGASSPVMIWKRVVSARVLLPTKTIFSPFLTVRVRPFKAGTPAIFGRDYLSPGWHRGWGEGMQHYTMQTSTPYFQWTLP